MGLAAAKAGRGSEAESGCLPNFAGEQPWGSRRFSLREPFSKTGTLTAGEGYPKAETFRCQPPPLAREQVCVEVQLKHAEEALTRG